MFREIVCVRVEVGVARLCPKTTQFEETGVPKQNLTWKMLLNHCPRELSAVPAHTGMIMSTKQFVEADHIILFPFFMSALG